MRTRESFLPSSLPLLLPFSPPLSRASSFAIFLFFFPSRLRDSFVSIHSGNLVTSFYEHALRARLVSFQLKGGGKKKKGRIVRFLMAV